LEISKILNTIEVGVFTKKATLTAFIITRTFIQAENEESNLWMENILDALKSCRRHCREASNVSTALAIVNMAVLQKDSDHTFETLKHRSGNFFTPLIKAFNLRGHSNNA